MRLHLSQKGSLSLGPSAPRSLGPSVPRSLGPSVAPMSTGTNLYRKHLRGEAGNHEAFLFRFTEEKLRFGVVRPQVLPPVPTDPSTKAPSGVGSSGQP